MRDTEEFKGSAPRGQISVLPMANRDVLAVRISAPHARDASTEQRTEWNPLNAIAYVAISLQSSLSGKIVLNQSARSS